MFFTYLYEIDGVPRYVGKGIEGRWIKHRKLKNALGIALREHYSKTGEWIVPTWIKSFSTEKEAIEHEKETIASIGRDITGDGPLWNKTSGGQGTSGTVYSAERRAKISASMRGRSLSEETKKKMSETLLKRDPEEVAKKLSAALTGKKRTNESKARYSESKTGEKNSFYGKTHTPEARAKIAEGNRRAWKLKKQE